MRQTVELFKALADETRLRILMLLCRQELCVCQIVEVLGIGQSKVSRHLAHLRNAGLVSDRREGLWMHYSLSPADGGLHGQVVAWLTQAADELGTVDLKALGKRSDCGQLCPDHHGPSDRTDRLTEVAPPHVR